MGCTTISEQEKSQVTFIAGSSDILSTTVARLYEGRQGRWEFMAVGIVSVVSNRVDKSNYIKVFDLKNNYRIIFEQEIYDSFEFIRQKDFFFVFEGDSCVYGLSFVDITEAAEFYGQILNCKQGNHGKTAAVNPNNYSNKTTASTLSPTPKIEKKKEKKGGFMAKFFSSEEKQMEISAPTNFKHESHIGWDPDNGFDIKNIPPDWRKLFQSAGIKKSELKNAETAQFIVDIIGEQMVNGAPPSQLNRSNPPAPPTAAQPNRPVPPSGVGKSVPPPPPPPTQKSPLPPPPPPSGGAAPPPPPPPPMSSGPPPPPPPMSSGPPPPPSGGGASSGRGDLLASIRSGASLKSVDKSNPLPDIQSLGNEGSRSLADTLAAAMANRRGGMREDDEEEDDDDDEWSDY
ncbi:hypothetical protein RB653_003393 [Dictyostelium firmibasis]|uniref:Uncharacterized protein n=1 Tax=Dictyostelium firmibasis TaxID=79012 RepID=A0AAN7U4L9_9MYCE